jgi:hypothetical protein
LHKLSGSKTSGDYIDDDDDDHDDDAAEADYIHAGDEHWIISFHFPKVRSGAQFL